MQENVVDKNKQLVEKPNQIQNEFVFLTIGIPSAFFAAQPPSSNFFMMTS